MLHEQIAADLRRRRDADLSLPSAAKLQGYYNTFRERFAPEVLQTYDGEALLNLMHNHGDRGSLVYWLEFKDDDEFPGRFGSIAGGSALKFGIYRRKETGEWMTGNPRDQRVLSLDEAIAIARKHRDQLALATERLAAFPVGADDAAYAELQADLSRIAPDVENTAWGHKYLSLMAPDKLDDYHVAEYQRFHLIKLLQAPPSGDGRYRCAGRFVQIAAELEMPLNHLTTILKILNLVAGLHAGDVVVAAQGNTLFGVGRVSGPYRFDPSIEPEIPHRRPVQWLSIDQFTFPTSEGVLSTIRELRKHPENLVEIERRILTPVLPSPQSIQRVDPIRPHTMPTLPGIAGRIQAVLERKSQVILYGPPGTGKTHWAELVARDLAAYSAFGEPFASLDANRKTELLGDGDRPGVLRMCTFHPAYGYEDFLEGYRPNPDTGGFELRNGMFKQLCADAVAQPNQRFYLIIDEINRGDIPRIFGELLTIFEKSKRGRAITLPLSGVTFAVPSNLYVIGTMNTADRSIALLDTALRRRFGFIELMPDSAVLGTAMVEGIPLGPWLKELNQRILAHVGRDARNLQIGHSYLMDGARPLSDADRFFRAIQEDILPLLEEYCYEDYALLAQILDTSLLLSA